MPSNPYAGFPLPLACVALACALGTDPAIQTALNTAREGGIPWVLIQRAPRPGGATPSGEDLLQRLILENQLQWTLRQPAETLDLARTRGWAENQPHWILLSAQGEEVADGAGLPPGEKLLEILRDRGLKPHWEVRRAFLKEHPDHGEAWGEEVKIAFQLVSKRMSALVAQGKAVRAPQQWSGVEMMGTTLKDPDPEEQERQGDLVFGDLAEALEGFARAPRWDSGFVASFGPFMALRGGAASPRLRRVCGALAAEVEHDLLQEGPEFPMAMRWLTLKAVAGPSLRDLPELPELPWAADASMTLVSTVALSLIGQQDWQGALAFLDARSPQPPPTASDPETWEGWRARKALHDALRVGPQWNLGRPQEALATLEAVRALAGPGWEFFRTGRYLGPKTLLDEKPIQAILRQPPLPAPPLPPKLPPLRLVLLDAPAWRPAWEGLRRADPLLPWSPQELQWAVPSPGEAAALRARAQWDSGPRWALLRGEALLASGNQCPVAEDLASLLSREAPSRLQVLDRFLEQHPAHQLAHTTRLKLLVTRMPEPRLEPRLAADARATSLPSDVIMGGAYLDFGPNAPWKPDEALWQWSAQQVLPQVEAQLRSWPSQPGLWRSWLAWARFHPTHPSPVAFADTLALWGDRDAWIGRLPLEVHVAVAAELRRTRAYPQLAAWMEAAWAHVGKEAGTEVEAGEWEERKTHLERLRPAVVDPLVESLRLLQRTEEARQVELAYRRMSTR